MNLEGEYDDRPRCVWCGSFGGYANRLTIHPDMEGGLIAECDWCWSSDYYRKKAANGKGNQNLAAYPQRQICCDTTNSFDCVMAHADNNSQ